MHAVSRFTRVSDNRLDFFFQKVILEKTKVATKYYVKTSKDEKSKIQINK